MPSRLLPTLLLLPACSILSAPDWLPSRPVGVLTCAPPPAERPADMSPGSWTSIVYLDRNGLGGVDAAIRIQAGRTWTLSNASLPGSYDRRVAAGLIDDSGALLGLPTSTFDRVRGMWATDSSCAADGEPIPTLKEARSRKHRRHADTPAPRPSERSGDAQADDGD